jgi:hypothetical protein
MPQHHTSTIPRKRDETTATLELLATIEEIRSQHPSWFGERDPQEGKGRT